MGSEFTAKCNNCGTEFIIPKDGGFTIHLLHCNKCGIEKLVKFIELGEIHYKYIKGLDVPYAGVTANLTDIFRKTILVCQFGKKSRTTGYNTERRFLCLLYRLGNENPSRIWHAGWQRQPYLVL